jgi:hypothetical protein
MVGRAVGLLHCGKIVPLGPHTPGRPFWVAQVTYSVVGSVQSGGGVGPVVVPVSVGVVPVVVPLVVPLVVPVVVVPPPPPGGPDVRVACQQPFGLGSVKVPDIVLLSAEIVPSKVAV